jgi:hypothetical protein
VKLFTELKSDLLYDANRQGTQVRGGFMIYTLNKGLDIHDEQKRQRVVRSLPILIAAIIAIAGAFLVKEHISTTGSPSPLTINTVGASSSKTGNNTKSSSKNDNKNNNGGNNNPASGQSNTTNPQSGSVNPQTGASFASFGGLGGGSTGGGGAVPAGVGGRGGGVSVPSTPITSGGGGGTVPSGGGGGVVPSGGGAPPVSVTTNPQPSSGISAGVNVGSATVGPVTTPPVNVNVDPPLPPKPSLPGL